MEIYTVFTPNVAGAVLLALLAVAMATGGGAGVVLWSRLVRSGRHKGQVEHKVEVE